MAIEQSWRMGGWLYLRDAGIVQDIAPDDLRTVGELAAAWNNQGIRAVAIRSDTCAAIHCAEPLIAAGYREITTPEVSGSSYRVFVTPGTPSFSR